MQIFLRAVRQQLRQHPDLWPLVGALVGVSVVGVASIWHASWKNDVWINRWSNNYLHDVVSWNKPQEKLYVPKHSKPNYKDDPILKDLLNEIYTHERYNTKGH